MDLWQALQILGFISKNGVIEFDRLTSYNIDIAHDRRKVEFLGSKHGEFVLDTAKAKLKNVPLDRDQILQKLTYRHQLGRLRIKTNIWITPTPEKIEEKLTVQAFYED